ncbi:MAG: acetylxylan esterase [Clostridia bacterium]|nr:acetylxylan esterase [Clostridia bacterium]
MINDLILKDTMPDEWAGIRDRLKMRILENLGKSPVALEPAKAQFKELEKYEEHGLTHIKIKYHVFADEWDYAVIILPKGLEKTGSAPAVVTIHGTNHEVGKYGVMDPVNTPRRAYAIELAKRGYVTISPDQFGFGEDMKTKEGKARFADFYKNYPDWSLTGRRVLGHMRAVDVLDALDYVKHDGYGVIGNSLGGQAALFLAGMDERIRVSIPSTGISPFATNAYRLVHTAHPIHPHEAKMLEKNGKSPWELNEMLGLCAPRALLLLEPFNDKYNPYTSVVYDCVYSAHKVYALLEHPERLCFYIHGDSHDTVDSVRELAYDYIDRFMQ